MKKEATRAPKSVVQSIVFDTSFTEKDAVDWLERHGFVHSKVDITKNTLRFRQVDPEPLEEQGYQFRFHTVKPGIRLLIAFPPH